MFARGPINLAASSNQPPAPAFLQGGGEMGALMRAHDWRSSSLGSPSEWPAPLQTALGLVLNTRHPMYIWWGSQLTCFYNDAYRQSIGPERHPDSLGRPAREVWEEIWGIIGPQIAQVMSGGGATWHENALVPITRNGQWEEVYWTYSYNPILDPNAPTGVGGVLVVCTETTAHMVAVRDAAEERERLVQLFEQAPSFVAILRGPEHRFELTNPSYQRLIGHRDVIGRTVAEALPDAAAQGYRELLDRVYSTGQAYTANGAKYAMQLTPTHAIDERYLDFVYQPIRGRDGAVNGIFVEGVDVTSRTLGDAARRDSEEQLRLATEAAEIGLWDVDVGSDSLFWPPRVKAMFGISADKLVSMRDDFYPCLHPDDHERVTEAFAAALDPKRRALYDVEYRTIGKEDGVIRWVAAKGRGVYNGDQCVRVIGTAIDVTTRKASEAELKVLNERLEQRVAEVLAEKQAAELQIRQVQKLEALGQLTGGVAHDFNNLLMIIKGGLSLLKRPSMNPERRNKLFSSVEQAADRGAALSRQLLAFARRLPLTAESIDLRTHIGGMRELLDRSLRGDVQVTTVFSDDLWPVKVDPAQLELVILNLCVNARDAMPSGGVITIEAANQSASQSTATGEFVALSVRDPGSGMPADVLEHVFEPFYTTKEIGKGSGLGLPQVHGFAQQSGGSVKIESRVGEGTKVTLLLPKSQSAPQAAVVALSLESTPQQGRTRGSVLLVEDDNEVAALVTEMLLDLGFNITRAASAEAALGALANDRQIDLVFSDVMMPGDMNGLELAAEVTRRRPTSKVLLTTGYTGDADLSVKHDVHILRKPYDIQCLDLALTEVLGRNTV